MLSSHVVCDWKEFMAALIKVLQHSAFNCTKAIDDLWPLLSLRVYSRSTYFSVHWQMDNKQKCTFLHHCLSQHGDMHLYIHFTVWNSLSSKHKVAFFKLFNAFSCQKTRKKYYCVPFVMSNLILYQLHIRKPVGFAMCCVK